MSQGLLVNGGLVKGGSDAQESANKFDHLKDNLSLYFFLKPKIFLVWGF